MPEIEVAVDTATYPLNAPDGTAYQALVDQAQAALATDGLCDLPGFLMVPARTACLDRLAPRFAADAFYHRRRHNIYFAESVPGLGADHPALAMQDTANRTLCADQLQDTVLGALYNWPAFARFLADVMGKPQLFVMEDPLAGVNAMSYVEGEGLNWHFDRSEFTTTLLLQNPSEGGVFEYAPHLRSDDQPNHQGVADLLEGRLEPKRVRAEPGTLTIFRGKNTAHRVTPSHGAEPRVVAVFSYFEKPGRKFTAEERRGFYGRAA